MLRKTDGPAPTSAVSTKDKIHSEIRGGVALKKMEARERPPSTPQLDGIAGAIAKALAERRGKLANDDEESEGSEEEADDDDWDD